MRVCSPVVLSYLDAHFEPLCPRKDYWIVACCFLLLCVLSNTSLKTPIFTPNGLREDTAVWKTPSSTPICNYLIVQWLWKNNGVAWGRPGVHIVGGVPPKPPHPPDDDCNYDFPV